MQRCLVATVYFLVLLSASAFGQWTDELLAACNGNSSDFKSSCVATGDSSHRAMCVYTHCSPASTANANHTVDYYNNLAVIQSVDGAVSWSGETMIVTDNPANYDVSLALDTARGKIWMLHSRWGTTAPGSELVIRYNNYRSDPTGTIWSAATMVLPASTLVCGWPNHWDSSLLVLQNGDLLVFAQSGDSNNSQRCVKTVRSTDGGQTWGAPQTFYDGPGQHSLAKATQGSDGKIYAVFENDHGGTTVGIDLITSLDSGNTWGAPQNVVTVGYHPFIGQQWAGNLTLLFSAQNQIFMTTSSDGGNTWTSANQISTSSGINPGFTVQCRGPVFTWLDTNGSRLIVKRYDWTGTCQ